MSIIYDALKKVEASAATNPGKDTGKNKKNRTKTYLLYVLTILFGLFIANIFYSWLSKRVVSQISPSAKINNANVKKKELTPLLIPIEQQAPLTKGEIPSAAKASDETKGQFSLNGVFFSGNDGYALINNMIVKTGDKIGGATIEKISLEEVDLKEGETTIKLSNRHN